MARGKSGDRDVDQAEHEKSGHDPLRRSLLVGGAAFGVAGATAALAQQTSPVAATKESGIDASVVGQCEKMLDLAFTDDERAGIVATMDDQLEAVRALRAIDFDNADAPASVFDPRLPGVACPEQSGGVTNAVPQQRETPGSADDIAFASVSLQAHWLRTRQISSMELTGIYLDRIAMIDGALKAFITVTADRAREEATQRDGELAEGTWRGPLHGVPYGLKDLIDTRNIPTTWGAMPYKDRVAQQDATIVTMLDQAGAVLLGKTTCGAIAYGDIWFGGVTRNPWDKREGSSGSSAGSASATAAGLCSFSIGTETLGSIVSPSTRCGTTGLRPTFGRVPRTGAMALCWSLDKIGPICRSVTDTALVLDAINGADNMDPGNRTHGFSWDAAQAVDGMTVGYAPNWFESGTNVDRSALEHLRRLPVTLKEISLPDWPYTSLLPQLEAEAAAAFQELTFSGKDDDLVWQELQAWPNTWRRAHFSSAVDLMQIDRFRRRVMGMMAEKFSSLDAIISPNYAGGLLIITNYTGHPCLTLRAGYVERPLSPAFGAPKPETPATARMPQNITLWGPLFEERKLLTLGKALEQSLAVSTDRPIL